MSSIDTGIEFIKANDLRIGDAVMEKSRTGNAYYVRHVIDIVRHTYYEDGQARAHVVMVGTKGSYSPNWSVFQYNATVRIKSRK